MEVMKNSSSKEILELFLICSLITTFALNLIQAQKVTELYNAIKIRDRHCFSAATLSILGF